MSPKSRNVMSTRAARIIFFGGWIAFFSVYGIHRFVFDFPDGSTAARISAGLSLAICLLIFGGIMGAAMIMNQKIQMDSREFIRWSVDIALLPMTMPILMLLCLLIGQTPITHLATPWFGEQNAGILGFEFGFFVVLVACPYALFVWPILHRVRRSRSSDGFLFAPKTWMVMCGFGLFSIATIFVQPPFILWIIVCASWLCFSAVYHWLLLPRFPRYTIPDDDYPASPNAG